MLRDDSRALYRNKLRVSCGAGSMWGKWLNIDVFLCFDHDFVRELREPVIGLDISDISEPAHNTTIRTRNQVAVARKPGRHFNRDAGDLLAAAASIALVGYSQNVESTGEMSFSGFSAGSGNAKSLSCDPSINKGEAFGPSKCIPEKS